MRFLGLDVGQKRIGVALSDPDGKVASPLSVVDVSTTAAVFSELKKLSDVHQVDEVVVGLPLTLRGERAIEAEKAVSFGEGLSQHLEIPVRFWDERLSTRVANEVLRTAKTKKKSRKQAVDKVAAAVILQGYLDWLQSSEGQH